MGEARDLNNRLQVVGWASSATPDSVPFVWLPEPVGAFPAGLNALPSLAGGPSKAEAINDRGQIVGVHNWKREPRRGVIWTQGQVADANCRVPNRKLDGRYVLFCGDINQSGQIAAVTALRGQPTGEANGRKGVRLTPLRVGITAVVCDFPDTLVAGESLDFHAHAINNEEGAQAFDSAALEISGPISHRISLYSGGDVPVAGNAEQQAAVALAVPETVPAGTYSIDTVLSEDGVELSRDGFDVVVVAN